jgi:hypothetical protein
MLGVIVPVVQQDRFDQDLIGGGFAGPCIGDDPSGEAEACLLKVCRREIPIRTPILPVPEPELR